MKTSSEKIIATEDGHIGWITFDNPARRNAMSLDMFQAIPEVISAYENDPAIRVIVLRGAGEKAFISGADISQFEQLRSNEENVKIYNAATEAAQQALNLCEKPTIAMIHGYCIGGGVGTATSCDLRIASETARFAIPAAKLGLGYRTTGVRRLMHLVGPSYTREIFYTARQFSAEEALGMRLINRVVPEAQLEGYVREYAETIANNAPLTIRAIKHSVTELLKDEDERDLDKANAMVEACFSSEDYIEGRRAFMEKRPPQFQGK